MVKLFPESRHKFEDKESLLAYIFGGKAIVTLTNKISNKSHTYYVTRPRDASTFTDDTYFVYAISIRGDVQKQFYLGMFEKGKFRLTSNSRFKSSTEVVRGIEFLSSMLYDKNKFSLMDVYHEGCCSKCGRQLTDPKSISIGIGPKCRKARVDTFLPEDI